MSRNKGSVDEALRDEVVDSVLVLHVGYEDDLGVAPADLLEGLQIPDLHGGLAVELLGSQAHQFGGFDVGAGRNYLALGQPPLLGGRRE